MKETLLAAFVLVVATASVTSQITLIDRSKELLITDLSVVDDPTRTAIRPKTPSAICVRAPQRLESPRTGAWTFGRIIENMAGAKHPSHFIEEWFQELKRPYTVSSGFSYTTNAGLLTMFNLIEHNWRMASGGPNAPLDPHLAPFRLLAIVNRMDLMEVTGQGTTADPIRPLNAGEGRFIFGLYSQSDPVNDPAAGLHHDFSVIFEFELPAKTCQEVKRWADRWHALGAMSFGDPCFNAALQAITDDFAGPNLAPGRPNGSLIKQVRTNEFLATVWEMREFNLVPDIPNDPNSAQLRHVTLKQTPDISLNGSPLLNNYLRSPGVYAPLASGRPHVVPDTWNGQPFLAGQVKIITTVFWDHPSFSPLPSSSDTSAFHHFALQTCNGCHVHETGTPFYMVHPRDQGVPAELADFLTGAPSVPDPRNPSVIRSFDDLGERASVLANLLNLSCTPGGAVTPTLLLGGPPPTSVIVPPAATFSGGQVLMFANAALMAVRGDRNAVLRQIDERSRQRTH